MEKVEEEMPQITSSQKKVFVLRHLDKIFSSKEESDEFLGTRNVDRLSPRILVTKFEDNYLRGFSFQEYQKTIGSVKKGDSEEFLSKNTNALNIREVLSLAGMISEAAIESIDDWALQAYDLKSTRELGMNPSRAEIDAWEARTQQRLISIRKSLIEDVFNGMMDNALDDAKQRAEVAFEIFENVRSDNSRSYYLVLNVASAASFRSFQNLQLLAILPSGDRRSFSFESNNSEDKDKFINEGTCTFPIYNNVGRFFPKIQERLEQHDYKQLWSLRVPSWKTGTYSWFQYTISWLAKLTLEQIEELLQPGVRYSLRFDQYDIRFQNNESFDYLFDAFAVYNGDDSKVDRLYERFAEEERKKELQLKKEAEERKKRLEKEAEERARRKEKEKADAEAKAKAEEARRQQEEIKKKRQRFKTLETYVTKVDFSSFDNLRLFIEEPESIKEISNLAKFCKENDMESTLLTKLREVQLKYDKQEVLSDIAVCQKVIIAREKQKQVGVYVTAAICFVIAVWFFVELLTWLGLIMAGVGAYCLWKKKSLFIWSHAPEFSGPAYRLSMEIRSITGV